MLAQAAAVISLIIDIYCLLIIIWAVVSMIVAFTPRFDARHPLVVALDRLASPVVKPIRRLLPTVGAMDISPLLAIFLLRTVQRLIVTLCGRTTLF